MEHLCDCHSEELTKKVKHQATPLELFLKSAYEVYGDRYDYSNSVYKKGNRYICIICRIHGEFIQSRDLHIKGIEGCKQCVLLNRRNDAREKFAEKAGTKFDGKFGYTKVVYVTCDTPVLIDCPEHGEFTQTPNEHLKSKYGCGKCAGNVQKTTEQFVAQVINRPKNSKYKYHLVDYKNAYTNVTIICTVVANENGDIHGEFEQTPSNHLDDKGCPYCARILVHPLESLAMTHPDLSKEWHHELNGTKRPQDYSYGSSEIVWWKCPDDPCGCHIWEAAIYSRTSVKQHGCPFHSKHKCCKHTNLAAIHPELISEWHPSNPPIENYSPTSNQVVLWECLNNWCGCHIYEAAINNRVAGKGCPYHVHLKLCDHNNLEALFPELKKEWHKDNEPMHLYPPGSDKKVKWVCVLDANHIWFAVIYTRTKKLNPSGCPHCALSGGYSKSQIEWLETIAINEDIMIQHALSPEGEYVIAGVGRVDGFCQQTNTVYEYHGDYWHGNPVIYDPEEFNPTVNKTYGELYDKTVKRDLKIRDLGYILIVKWETEFEY